MTFTSMLFLIGIFPWFAILYKFAGINKNNSILRIILILLANSVFYIWGGIGSFLFLCLYSLVIYLLQNIETSAHKKFIFVISIIVAATPLICIKYTSFFINNINSIFGINITAPSLVLPLGISFFSFEAISLLSDVYKEKIEKANLLFTYLYLSFFPTVTSGPIIRFDEFKEGLNKPFLYKADNFYAIERIIIGLSKKVLIADKIAPLANYYFDGAAIGNNYSTLGFWIGSIAYTLQLYFDFSGYTDMAIGIGSFLGFTLRENFNKPYQSSTISEFWKRWHISLTQWFRDYIYIPLGGNRCSVLRHLFNMLVVWIITGIWHGANWTFILWGFSYFILLVIEKYTPLAKKISSTVFGHLYTLFFVNILWVLFRSDTLSSAGLFIKGMFGFGSGPIEEKALRFLPFTLFAIALCLPWDKWLSTISNKKICKIIKACILLIIAAMSLCAVINSSYVPYIYGNF